MTNIKTYTAGIIAALGIAGAALVSAGPAAAMTNGGQENTTTHNEPGTGHLIPSPEFAPRHVDPAIGFGPGDSPAFTHRHHRR